MSVTIGQAANALSISLPEMLTLTKQNGVQATAPNDIISDEDLNKIELFLKKETQTFSSTNQKATYAQKGLEKTVNEYRIFIDTCSLLHFAADKFWMNIIPLLSTTRNKVIVPTRAVDELEKHKTNDKKPDLAETAKNTIKVLQQLQHAGLVELRGEETDNFADNVFQVVFTKFRMTHKLLLITQDGNLARDIEALNNIKSVRANRVQVKRINQYGYLSNFIWDDPQNTSSEKTSQFTKVVEETDIPDDAFELCKSVTQIPDSRLPITIPCQEYTTVYTPKGSVQLLQTLASGGEGTIYATDTPYVAKIYKNENNTKRKYEKIKLILKKEVKFDGVCFPVSCLYNSKKEFIGYLMPLAKGKELQKSIFIKPLLLKNFPTWKKRDTVELCITILNKIKYLHDRNIIMGDINPANILVVSPTEVYFVDTDSYQVQDYPCPVGTINYTAPEIQHKCFSSFLRTMGNENFAVATLLFMIMLPGKPPYSQQGGENPIENIINMDFSYPFGDNSNKKTPDGPWRYIWSHLTYDLKKAFYNTFRKGGDNSTESTRLCVDEWLSLFEYFLQLLDSGKFASQDPMSEQLFPTRHKKNPKVIYTTCKLCGNDIAENQCQNGICRDCLNTGEVYKCKKCGKEILFTNYQKYIKNAKKYDLCPECFEYGNAVKTNCRCVDCGRTFEITNSQYDFYQSKGFDIPKRCKSCREAKKNRSYGNTTSYYSHSTSNSTSTSKTSGSTSSSNGTFCFITTAVCEYWGKPDNCIELVTFRNFRDGWLRNQADGNALISEYYESAPLLVSKLKSSAFYSCYCEMLWNDYLNPCFELICSGELDSCKNLYIKMVHHLRNLLI